MNIREEENMSPSSMELHKMLYDYIKLCIAESRYARNFDYRVLEQSDPFIVKTYRNGKYYGEARITMEDVDDANLGDNAYDRDKVIQKSRAKVRQLLDDAIIWGQNSLILSICNEGYSFIERYINRSGARYYLFAAPLCQRRGNADADALGLLAVSSGGKRVMQNHLLSRTASATRHMNRDEVRDILLKLGKETLKEHLDADGSERKLDDVMLYHNSLDRLAPKDMIITPARLAAENTRIGKAIMEYLYKRYHSDDATPASMYELAEELFCPNELLRIRLELLEKEKKINWAENGWLITATGIQSFESSAHEAPRRVETGKAAK
ncbi:MAG: hypothetical protein V2A77_00425 [Pseudomonadota bacterium]